ncbi:GIY-YIG nuclease family protein [Hymenobacter sp. HDW8]|uniref:GIY-YIG nuclease family protein n=1 Tax=Hymenobacter sp. HDW8 TaxID=2714932 RepID=UPI00140B6B9E|nr:GIY-YIG nuclease family protein [Hymenobacter sp. HDW8]QIL77295.1 GIY-YIG nuclease family protein [Hymenobacter sp. HDW8]
MTTFGKSVRIFLKDGTSTGIRFAEIVNHTIQSVTCPRTRVNELYTFSEANRPGIYFLFGIDESTTLPKVYIGEAENIFSRIQEHANKKDFWDEVIFFTSKDENLTKSHVKYLESKAIEIAFLVKRNTVDNINQPQLSTLPVADKEAMEELLVYIKLLLGVFGKYTLEPIAPQQNKPHTQDLKSLINNDSISYDDITSSLFLKVGTLKANAIQTNEGLVVCKNSEAAEVHTANLGLGYRNLREDLIANNSLVLNENKYLFQNDVLFGSPSAAAAVIVGYNINGRENWKDVNGKSLNEIEKQKFNLLKPIEKEDTVSNI